MEVILSDWILKSKSITLKTDTNQSAAKPASFLKPGRFCVNELQDTSWGQLLYLACDILSHSIKEPAPSPKFQEPGTSLQSI